MEITRVLVSVQIEEESIGEKIKIHFLVFVYIYFFVYIPWLCDRLARVEITGVQLLTKLGLQTVHLRLSQCLIMPAANYVRLIEITKFLFGCIDYVMIYALINFLTL